MKIRRRQRGGEAIYELIGPLDASTAQRVEDAILPRMSAEKITVLDFANVNYMSSVGLRIILSMYKKAKQQESQLELRNVNSMVMELLEMTGFTEFVSIK